MSRRPPELIARPKRQRNATDFYAPADPEVEACRGEVHALKKEISRLHKIVSDYENTMLTNALPEAPHEQLRMSKKERQSFNSRVSRKIREFKKELQQAINKMEED